MVGLFVYYQVHRGPVLQCCYRCQGNLKIKKGLVLVAILLLIGGCVQVGQDTGSPPPTVVFVPSDSSYLLACVSELQGLKKKDFDRYSEEAAIRLEEGDDRDTLQFICLTLHQRADYKQFKRGEKLLRKYIKEHPDTSDDMQGLIILLGQLEQAMVNRWVDRKKLLVERDELAVQVETLQSQLDQLKNIENIIKNRER